MSTNMKRQLGKVSALSASLDELETKLEPLLSKPLPDTVGSLETLQQAKLQVVLPYLINDLIFIYLKTRGIDPKTHQVVAELDRVRQYFGKIKDAEESGKERTTGIDKAAAGRFIKHAITQAKQNVSSEPSTDNAGPSSGQPSTIIPVRITEKMKERELYQQRVAEESDGEDAGLEIIDDDTEDMIAQASKGKGRGVARARVEVQEGLNVGEPNTESKKKKRQRPMDPFGSFGEDKARSSDSPQKPKKKKSKKLAAVIDNDTATDSRASSDTDLAQREAGSKKKRSKKTG